MNTSILKDGRVLFNKEFLIPVWDRNGVDFTILIPKGFKSDGATIPRILWSIIGPPIASIYAIAAFAHDYLCDESSGYDERVLADAVFRKLLNDFKVPLWKRIAMYVGVRVQGRITWASRCLFAITCLIVMLAVILGAAPATPKALPEPHVVIGSCRFHSVYDADTVKVSITRIVRVRLANCWAPEITKTKHPSEKRLGLKAKVETQKLAKPGDLCRLEVLTDGDEDLGDGLTFGRVVGEVYIEASDGFGLGEKNNAKGTTFKTKAELEDYLTERDKDERFIE